jgi:hypothetical protein
MAGTNMGILSRDISFPGGLLVLVEFPHIFRNKMWFTWVPISWWSKNIQSKQTNQEQLHCHSHIVSFWLRPGLWLFFRGSAMVTKELATKSPQWDCGGMQSTCSKRVFHRWTINSEMTGGSPLRRAQITKLTTRSIPKKMPFSGTKKVFCWPKHIKM